MDKLMEFLMEQEVRENETVEVDIAGFPYPFVVRATTEAESKSIRKTCQKVTFDKKSRQKSAETDSDLYNSRLVAACCVSPNFKDAQLQAKYGGVGAEALIDAMLKPGQFIDLLLAVQEINGFSSDMDELRDEAKN